MNIDNSSDSNNLSPCTIVSKYFLDAPVMDESLSDFQEKRRNNLGPKNKPTNIKSKSKKAPKRIRGQKDIRTAITSKKNDLVAFSNDFEKVCRQSGIDIDSEQLQLAIALSKSVQKSENIADDNATQISLTSKERVGKIRTTLLEYGFKVPDLKITATKSKRLQYRKRYKLLVTTESERQQFISLRYSQVLLKNIQTTEAGVKPSYDTIINLYKLATDISYDILKNKNIYYVNSLLEQSSSKVGCLLREWSEIPGRPVSPTLKQPIKFSFNDIEFAQDNLNILLSGSLKNTQDFVKKIMGTFKSSKETDKETENVYDIDEINCKNVDITGCPPKKFESNSKLSIEELENNVKAVDIEAPLLEVPYKVRSCSPDMFDDEISCAMDSSTCSTKVNQECSYKFNTREFTVSMDLTECVTITETNIPKSNLRIEKPLSQLSKSYNLTQRRSNDFMEITDCIATSSQVLVEACVQDSIDLTECSNVKTNYNTIVKNDNVESTDLTQSSCSDNSLPFVHLSGKQNESVEDTVIIDEDNICIKSGSTQSIVGSIKSNDINTSNISSNSVDNQINSFGDILLSKTNAEDTSVVLVLSDQECEDLSESKTYKNELEDYTIKLVDPISDNITLEQNTYNYNKSKTESFFDEYYHQHSTDESKEDQYKNPVFDTSVSESDVNDQVEDGKNIDIDLTQSSDSLEIIRDDYSNNDTKCSQTSHNVDSLGKKGDVSIDYDDLFDNVIECHHSNTSDSNKIAKSTDSESISTADASKAKIDHQSSASDNQEVFDISDKELNYSLHRSRNNFCNENYKVDGLENMYDVQNESKDNSYLPMVDLKCNIKESINAPNKLSKTETSTPFKLVDKAKVLETPENNEYEIRTDQVTPMLDYASLTTPERIKELDKYGLKPFKRKRAIQLLTHLYNQTHPTVEACSSDDHPSPSKRFKTNHLKTGISPRKVVTSPKKNLVCNKNLDTKKLGPVEGILDGSNSENVYDITTVVPDIRNIECCEQDWVFQKREKAKIYSCRVPLHVAFHNYVSARRGLRDSILRYEPINIDLVHKGLVADGHRYDPKDLLKFMDKKCVTVKTADNTRNKKNT